MFLGKMEFEKGKNIRRDIINEIVADPEILRAIKYYLPSKKESKWIPRAIAIRSRLLLEFACDFCDGRPHDPAKALEYAGRGLIKAAKQIPVSTSLSFEEYT